MQTITIHSVLNRTHFRSTWARRWVEAILAAVLLTSTQAQVIVHVYDLDFSLNPKGEPVVDPVINVGDTVRWVGDEGFHSTTAASGQSLFWNSGNHSPAFQFDFTFTQPGTFKYFCDIHGSDRGGGNVSGMSGIITVVPEPAGQAAILGSALFVFAVLRHYRLKKRSPTVPCPS